MPGTVNSLSVVEKLYVRIEALFCNESCPETENELVRDRKGVSIRSTYKRLGCPLSRPSAPFTICKGKRE